MANLARLQKSPSERKRYTVNYNNWLAESETIVEKSFVITPATVPPLELVTSAVNPSGKGLVFYIGGGVDKEVYKIEVFITTSDSQIKEDTITVYCKEQ